MKSTTKFCQILTDFLLVQVEDIQHFNDRWKCKVCPAWDRHCQEKWCHDEYYRFTDKATGTTYELKKSHGYDHFNLDRANAEKLRQLILSRAESAMRINVQQSTASSNIWPGLMPGSEMRGHQDSVWTKVIVEKSMCFSKDPSCTNGGVGMPAGHSYETFNITSIEIRGGALIDWIRVTYKSGNTLLTQELGNRNGGSLQTLSNLEKSPVTKATWWNTYEREFGIGSLTGIELTQAGGQFTKHGHPHDKSTMTDDFSLWKGNVYLCGLTLHGTSNRVEGVAPHWCQRTSYPLTIRTVVTNGSSCFTVGTRWTEGRFDSGAAIVQSKCVKDWTTQDGPARHAQITQTFRLVPSGDPAAFPYNIMTSASSNSNQKCLTIKGGGLAPYGQWIVIQDCDPGSALQRFSLVRSGNKGSVSIRTPIGSEYCLAILASPKTLTEDWKNIRLDKCKDAQNNEEKFTIEVPYYVVCCGRLL